MALVLFVMSFELGRLFDEFTVDRVFHLPLNQDGDGFLHFIANNHTDSLFSKIPFHVFSFGALVS